MTEPPCKTSEIKFMVIIKICNTMDKCNKANLRDLSAATGLVILLKLD